MRYRQPSDSRTDQVAGSPALRLSLCMIVRNNEATLPASLAGIRPWVDDMVVVDTGSRDATPAIAQSFGARLFQFPWCDDFSAARNESLRHARGEWLFWMDSDDTIDAENGRKLRELANHNHDPSLLGFVMQVHCPGPDARSPDEVTVVDHVKMVRNRPELRFQFRIHEQLLPSIRRLGGDVAWSDVFVVHSGSDHSPQGRQKKLDRDLRLLALEFQDYPNHPFVLFNLGMTYEDQGSYAVAIEHLEHCLAVSHPGESHVRKAYALLVSAHAKFNQHEQALRVCLTGRELFPTDPELAFRHGTLAHGAGELGIAEQAYLSALRSEVSRHFSSVDRGVFGYKARHNLALVYRDMGRPDLVEWQCREAALQSPRYAPTRRLLVEALLVHRRLVAAEIEIETMEEIAELRAEAAVLRADLAELGGDVPSARRILEQAECQHPESTALLERLCRLLFFHGTPDDAERALVKLIEREPENAAAHRNLAALYGSTGRQSQVELCLRDAPDLGVI